MLLAAHLEDRASNYVIKIYGTDVDEDALSAARHYTAPGGEARRALLRLVSLRDAAGAVIGTMAMLSPVDAAEP